MGKIKSVNLLNIQKRGNVFCRWDVIFYIYLIDFFKKYKKFPITFKQYHESRWLYVNAGRNLKDYSYYNYPLTAELFKKLINNMSENGYNFDNPIIVYDDMLLHDGAHRLAMSVYLNLDVSYEKTILPSKSIHDLNWYNDTFFLSMVNILLQYYQKYTGNKLEGII